MNTNLAYQDEFPEELINGEVMAMSPSTTWHNYISGNIYGIFWDYLKGKKKCVPFADGTAVQLTENDRFIPDFMIVCDRSKIKSRWVWGAPDLLVEVLSPSTTKNDRFYKKDVYEASGVPEYWIVSPREKTIEVYLLQDSRYVLDNLYTFYSDAELEDMSEDEKSTLVTEFKCHLFNDLVFVWATFLGIYFDSKNPPPVLPVPRAAIEGSRFFTALTALLLYQNQEEKSTWGNRRKKGEGLPDYCSRRHGPERQTNPPPPCPCLDT